VLDDGRLTDNQGRTVSFKNCLLIMTSNIAADYIQQESARIDEHNRDAIYQSIKESVLETLRRTLRPEFLNRVDETIVFSALTPAELKEIVKLQLKRLESLLAEKEIKLAVNDAAVKFIAESSYDPAFGARPIKRFISKELSRQVAKLLLSGDLKPGQTLHIGFADNQLQITAIAERADS
jgi:ATP-dependent Clp protease ATP-binding subunit ClpB